MARFVFTVEDVPNESAVQINVEKEHFADFGGLPIATTSAEVIFLFLREKMQEEFGMDIQRKHVEAEG